MCINNYYNGMYDETVCLTSDHTAIIVTIIHKFASNTTINTLHSY